MEHKETLPRSLNQLLVQLDKQGIRDYRRYQAVHRYLDAKAREKAVPLTGTFELTPLCNLDCKMCYVHLNKTQMGNAELLTTGQWKQIMEQAVKAGMLYARLTGGECLTYPGFRELYLYLRQQGIETGILTNGVLLDKEMVAFLTENKPAMVQITLYGASEEGYERVTGHRCFQTVRNHILALREAGIPVSVVTTPNAYMTDGVDIVWLMQKLDFPLTINAGLMVPREETGRSLQEAPLDTYIQMIRCKQMGSETLDAVIPEDLPDVGGAGKKTFGTLCGAGRSAFSIDWQGNMKPCNNFPCAGEDVLTLGFAEAWRRTHTTAAQFPQPEECSGCRYEGVCKHCVAEHAAGAPLGHASPNICAWGKRMVAEGLLTLPASDGGHDQKEEFL